jgi:hypothetical protein
LPTTPSSTAPFIQCRVDERGFWQHCALIAMASCRRCGDTYRTGHFSALLFAKLEDCMEYQRDDVRRRVTRTVSGHLSVAATLAYLERQAADGTWGYASLHDMRGVTSWMSFAQSAVMMNRGREIVRTLGRRGSVAIVVGNPALIPIGQTSAIVEHDIGRVGFFRDTETAEAWLDEPDADGNSPTP